MPAEGGGLDAAFDALVEDLRAATYDQFAADRLRSVGLLCVVRVAGHDHLEAWLHFDAKPPEVDGRAPGRHAEIELVIAPERVSRFWEEALSMTIVRGETAYEGPVRRLLQVYPILRAQAAARRASLNGGTSSTTTGAAA